MISGDLSSSLSSSSPSSVAVAAVAAALSHALVVASSAFFLLCSHIALAFSRFVSWRAESFPGWSTPPPFRVLTILIEGRGYGKDLRVGIEIDSRSEHGR